jgi:hypothetical protein
MAPARAHGLPNLRRKHWNSTTFDFNRVILIDSVVGCDSTSENIAYIFVIGKASAIFSDVESQPTTESMRITRLKSNALKKAQAHNANAEQSSFPFSRLIVGVTA